MTTIPETTRQNALQMVSTGNFAAKTLREIREQFPDWEDRIKNPESLPLKDPQRKELARAMRTDLTPIRKILDTQRIQFLLPEDPAFPDALRNMVDPPFGIFLRGEPINDGIRIGIVGTRRMTPYGQRATELLSRELTHHGATIVSGLAFGVDIRAHRACVDAGGTTIAVLAGGVDTHSITPPSHTRVAEQCLSQHQATLLSEYPPGPNVPRFRYLVRNRLIAALSDALIVTEADHESGALATARHALENGREVLAVPGDIFHTTCRGTNALIANGARPCRNAEDALSALGFKNTQQAKQIANARKEIPITPNEATLLTALHEPRSVDELSRQLHQPIAHINALISLLELKGRIVSVSPKTYIKT